MKYYILVLSFLSAFPCSADTLVRYYVTGINGGPPVKTLSVYTDGTAALIIDSLFASNTLSAVLDSAELAALAGLFFDNGWDSLDSVLYSGCLACPEFSITYDGQTVRGDTPAGSPGLAQIVNGFNDLVQRLPVPAGIIPTDRPFKIVDKSSSLFPRLSINFNGRITRYGILRPGDKRSRVYDLKGNLIRTLCPGSNYNGHVGFCNPITRGI